MKIIQPFVYYYAPELERQKLMNIERSARLCYKSEDKIGKSASLNFLSSILSRGHESVIEHEKATVYMVVDRGVTHEIVRHRIASYSQESTRYCNYLSDKFGNEITVIEPFFYLSDKDLYSVWMSGCLASEKAYISLIKKSSPQEARSVLPNSLKAEIAVTFNFREWRHFFKLRCAKDAHPQMQQIAIPLLLEFKKKLNPLFDDIKFNKEFPEKHYAKIKVVSGPVCLAIDTTISHFMK